MKYATLAAVCGASIVISTPAFAVETLGDFTIEEGSFGAGTGVHSDETQEGNTVTGFVNQDDSEVTFFSEDVELTITGSGQAVISPLTGVITDLLVSFEKTWDRVTFSFDGEDGDFELSINGTDFGVCDTCVISSRGQNKYIVSGGISSLGFKFDPGLDSARQFRVEGVTAPVPEPGTWAMMLFGFGALGFAMRRRRGKGSVETRVRYAL